MTDESDGEDLKDFQMLVRPRQAEPLWFVWREKCAEKGSLVIAAANAAEAEAIAVAAWLGSVEAVDPRPLHVEQVTKGDVEALQDEIESLRQQLGAAVAKTRGYRP